MTGATLRRLAAIVSADVVGYSRLMGGDEVGTLAAFNAHRDELIDPLIGAHGGRIVKTMGDGLLLEFPSVVDAVEFSVEVQRGMAERNAGQPDARALRFRIGVHLGDIIVEDDDIFGDGVNVAARIEALADPDGIALSDDAHRQVRDRLDHSWKDGGEHHAKNIVRALRIWHWAPGPNEVSRSPVSTGTHGADQPPSPSPQPSIAVLPFDNMSGEKEQEYFADGITEDIITELSKISGLLVISRNSTFTYKGKATKAQDICRDLGVRCILEGSVRKAGGRVRITAQLIDGQSGGHLWADRYDRELADIFAVQDEVTEKIVRVLEVKLIEGDNARPSRVETDNPEAYDCVLRGREQYRLFSRDGNAAARKLYERAIELDPNYAAAHAALSETHLHDWFMGAPEALDLAYEQALTAKNLDPTLPIVNEALSAVQLFKRQHDAAVASAERWIEVEPGNAEAYANLAGILQFSGQPERVAGLIDTAKRLNPFYPFYYILYIGQACFDLHRFEEAVAAITRSIAHNPHSLPSHFYLAASYGQLGDDALAQKALTEVFRLNPEFTIADARAIAAYRREADLELLLDGLRKAGLPE